MYFQNPEAKTGFCVDSVYVNNSRFFQEYSASAFELSFDSTFKIGDPLKVELYHKKGCQPKLLQVFGPRRFDPIKFSNERVSDSAIFSVDIKTTAKVLVFVQQYRWNKWIKVNGTERYVESGHFEFDLSKEKHSGDNKFRLVYSDPFSRKSCSMAMVFANREPKFKFHYLRDENRVVFDQWTRYELYDAYGNLINMGEGTELKVAQYKKGIYYLNYDNESGKLFLKPKK